MIKKIILLGVVVASALYFSTLHTQTQQPKPVIQGGYSWTTSNGDSGVLFLCYYNQIPTWCVVPAGGGHAFVM